jgi:hypothetical protein
MTEFIREEEPDAERQALIDQQLAEGSIEMHLLTKRMLAQNRALAIRFSQRQAERVREIEQFGPDAPDL